MKLLFAKLSLALSLGLMAMASPSLNAGPTQKAPETETIYSLSEVDKKPVVLNMQIPAYPKEAQEEKLSGRVVVQFILDSEGQTHEVQAVKSTNRVFEAPAVNSVLGSTFEPAEIDGEAVTSKVRIPIDFKP